MNVKHLLQNWGNGSRCPEFGTEYSPVTLGMLDAVRCVLELR